MRPATRSRAPGTAAAGSFPRAVIPARVGSRPRIAVPESSFRSHGYGPRGQTTQVLFEAAGEVGAMRVSVVISGNDRDPAGVVEPLGQRGPCRVKFGRQGGRGHIAGDQDVVGVEARTRSTSEGTRSSRNRRALAHASDAIPSRRLLKSRSGFSEYRQKWMSERWTMRKRRVPGANTRVRSARRSNRPECRTGCVCRRQSRSRVARIPTRRRRPPSSERQTQTT